MKKIINGKKYDTSTATCVGSWTNGYTYSDFGYLLHELYRKRTGEFFLYKEGGPMTEMAVYHGNSMSGSSAIKPLTENEAKEWAEEYLSGDEFEEIFGEVEE